MANTTSMQQLAISLASAIILFSILAMPVSAVSYLPGVKNGDYVKYGNYWGIGDTAFIATTKEMDWLTYSIVSVNGAEVTIASSGALKNGTTVGGGTATYNVELGTMSTKYASNTPYTNGPIIASNLNQGDVVPRQGYLKVNKTQTMSYLGVSRAVNIVNSTWSTPAETINYGYVYDQQSGMLLEMQVENNQTQPTAVYTKYGSSIIETNLFQPEQTPTPPTPTPTTPVTASPTTNPTTNPSPTNPTTPKQTSNQTTQPTATPSIPEYGFVGGLLVALIAIALASIVLLKKNSK